MGAVATIIWTTVAGYFAEKGISKGIKYLAKNPTKNYFGSVNKNYVIIGGVTSLVLVSLAFILRKK